MSEFNIGLVKITDTEIIENTIKEGAVSVESSTLSYAAAHNFNVQMDIEQKYVRVYFTLEVRSFTEDNVDELLASAIFTIAFGFEVANLAELASDRNGVRTSSLELLWNLFGIVYDRGCGVISGLAQGSSLQSFVMPILTTEELHNLLSKENGYSPN